MPLDPEHPGVFQGLDGLYQVAVQHVRRGQKPPGLLRLREALVVPAVHPHDRRAPEYRAQPAPRRDVHVVKHRLHQVRRPVPLYLPCQLAAHHHVYRLHPPADPEYGHVPTQRRPDQWDLEGVPLLVRGGVQERLLVVVRVYVLPARQHQPVHTIKNRRNVGFRVGPENHRLSPDLLQDPDIPGPFGFPGSADTYYGHWKNRVIAKEPGGLGESTKLIKTGTEILPFFTRYVNENPGSAKPPSHPNQTLSPSHSDAPRGICSAPPPTPA